MAGASPLRDGVGMVTSHSHNESIAASTFELRRAAGDFEQHASAPGVLGELPLALADIEKALERLAPGASKAAQAVEEAGTDALSPEARALRWHLFHLAARLRGAENACPDARRWARLVLAQHDIADDEEQATDSPPVLARRLVPHGDAVAQ
jgi:hypothetical protein